MGKLAPSVKVELDRERVLRFDLNAMVDFEEASGKSVREISEEMPMRDFRILIWACLVADDPDLTLRDVGAIANSIASFQELKTAITNILAGSMPELDPDAAPKAPSQ